MTNPWISRIGGFFAILLLLTGLIFLQVLNAEKDLVFCLPAYGVIAIATLLAVVTSRWLSQLDRLCLWSSAVFFGYVIIRAISSPDPYAARADLYSVLAALTLYGLTVTALSSSTRRIAVIVALVAFGVVHVLVSVVQAGLGENLMVVSSLETVERNTRGTGLYVDPDHLAGLLEVLGILALSIACWSRWPKWTKVIVAYLAAICYLGLALTGSRGGYLSASASLILFFILSLIVLRAAGTDLLLKFGGLGLILLVGGFLATWFLIHQSAPLSERVHNIFAPDQGRLDLSHAAIDQWKLQPVVGTGSGTFRFYGRQFRPVGLQADPGDVHNDYLHLLCEYGLLGAAGFLFFFIAHLRNGTRTFLRLGPERAAAGVPPLSDRLALNIGALCAISSYVIHSAVDFNLHIPANALVLAFVFGIVANPGVKRGTEIQNQTVRGISTAVVALLSVVLLVQCARLLPGEYFGEQARAALRDEDPTAAISFADRALVYEQHNPNIYFYRGRALISLGFEEDQIAERPALYERALASFGKAYQLAPLDGTYPLEMAFVYDQTSRFAEAEKMFALARARDPRSEAVAQLYKAHLESAKSAQPEKSDDKRD